MHEPEQRSLMAPPRRTRCRARRHAKKKATILFLLFFISFPVPRSLSRSLEHTARTEPPLPAAMNRLSSDLFAVLVVNLNLF